MPKTSNTLSEDFEKLNELEKLFYKPYNPWYSGAAFAALKELYSESIVDIIYKNNSFTKMAKKQKSTK